MDYNPIFQKDVRKKKEQPRGAWVAPTRGNCIWMVAHYKRCQ